MPRNDMKGAAVGREHQPIRSDLGWSTTDRITVRGLDLANEIIGHFNLGDMAFLEFTGRKPTPAESKLLNAVTVTLVEHGITPSSIAARMTIAGAPEALQAAVAAGLCGLGSVFVGSMEHAAVMLEQALPYGADHSSADLVQLAAEIVARKIVQKTASFPAWAIQSTSRSIRACCAFLGSPQRPDSTAATSI